MTDNLERKMATIRRIAEIKPISGADRIVAYRVDGWWVVDTVGKYQVGDLVVYCEPDSWVPHSLAPFLTKNGDSPRVYNKVEGQKLRTIKLKGQLSQGLLLSTSIRGEQGLVVGALFGEGQDATEFLGIQKWEPQETANMSGDPKGSFPFFIPKTDAERVQNLDVFKFCGMELEATEKLEGTSFTCFVFDGQLGVCSRNQELKQGESIYWKVAEKANLEENLLQLGLNIAIQGEIIGPNIQGNIYKLSKHELHVFSVYDIDKQQYYNHDDRLALVETLGLSHVPVIGMVEGMPSVDDYLEYAKGTSSLNESTTREGVVFKADGICFKAIDNDYLLKQK